MSAGHPATRFRAARSIVAGTPLKSLLDPTAVELIGESFAAAHAGFDRAGFQRLACAGLDGDELMPRAQRIAAALAAHLPAAPAPLADALVAALGPPLAGTEGFGLAPFFYLPHVCLIRTALVGDYAAGMRANRAVTTRFSAEFSIRPFLLRYTARCLGELAEWTADPDPHVRRLVSEGSRPRLPWAERLPPFIADPTPTLALLEWLKDDPVLYVRRSVANHLGDIAKDHLDLALATARRWLDEADALPAEAAAARRWLIRHAIRHPAQRGVATAVRLRRAAGGR